MVEKLKQVEIFHYLGRVVSEKDGFGEVRHGVGTGRGK